MPPKGKKKGKGKGPPESGWRPGFGTKGKITIGIEYSYMVSSVSMYSTKVL